MIREWIRDTFIYDRWRRERKEILDAVFAESPPESRSRVSHSGLLMAIQVLRINRDEALVAVLEETRRDLLSLIETLDSDRRASSPFQTAIGASIVLQLWRTVDRIPEGALYSLRKKLGAEALEAAAKEAEAETIGWGYDSDIAEWLREKAKALRES